MFFDFGVLEKGYGNDGCEGDSVFKEVDYFECFGERNLAWELAFEPEKQIKDIHT